MTDWNLVFAITLIVSAALWFTTHVALYWGLWPRMTSVNQRWLGWFPPSAWLVVVWGFRNGLRGRSLLWLVCAVTYLTTWVCVRAA